MRHYFCVSLIISSTVTSRVTIVHFEMNLNYQRQEELGSDFSMPLRVGEFPPWENSHPGELSPSAQATPTLRKKEEPHPEVEVYRTVYQIFLRSHHFAVTLCSQSHATPKLIVKIALVIS